MQPGRGKRDISGRMGERESPGSKMKYIVLIIDGAAGHPIPEKAGKTSLELASTPYLDRLASQGRIGMTSNVPEGMEPSSAIACMSILGYNPRTYYRGRSAIEAGSMGIEIARGEVVFRCNLVSIDDGRMADYSAGHIDSQEAGELILALERELGDSALQFFPGVSYRHILKIKNHPETLCAECTPPHDIPGQLVAAYLPRGEGSAFLRDLMQNARQVLKTHPRNLAKIRQKETPASDIWLFWPSGQLPPLPSFQELHGLKAGMLSGVDLLRGLALMTKMEVIKVKGVTDGLDNDYAAQAEGAFSALDNLDLVVVHVEAPDEAGHSGSLEHKVEAIEKTDEYIIRGLEAQRSKQLRVLVLPDHPTPLDIRTHTPEPVPFLFWGSGIAANGASRFTEAQARLSSFKIEHGYDIIKRLIQA
jgi:2,3-bisphosphoglycerate-independent phosphoglycerate mutase